MTAFASVGVIPVNGSGDVMATCGEESLGDVPLSNCRLGSWP